MADTITSGKYLEIEMGFADDDTRKLKIPNPRASVTTEQITAAQSAFINSEDNTKNLVVGDRAGAQFVGFLSADSVVAQQVDFDLG